MTPLYLQLPKRHNAMKKIAIFVPTLARGGAERVASQLSSFISKQDQTHVIVMKRDIDYEYAGTLIDLNINTILKRNIIFRLRDIFKAIYKLNKIKKAAQFDIVISFLELANIPNVLSGHAKTIISVREHRLSSTQHDMQRRLTNRLVKLLYNRADKIVVNSEGIKYSLIEDFGIALNKIQVISNPIDTAKIEKEKCEELEQQYKKIYSSPVVLTSGRLSQQKGQWHLIRAFKKVVQSIPEAKLIILGGGELRTYLTDLAELTGLKQSVFFPGFQKNPFKFVARASVFVLPSLWEGFPNALIEAMACGIPVISSDCNTGPREILAPDTNYFQRAESIEYAKYGILFPVPDGEMKRATEPLTKEEDLLALSILELLTNKKVHALYSAKAAERVKDFSSGIIMEKWKHVIEEVGMKARG